MAPGRSTRSASPRSSPPRPAPAPSSSSPPTTRPAITSTRTSSPSSTPCSPPTDEVFFDYPLRPTPHPSPALTPLATLAFTISGLSKVAALPQLKLAWWHATGPAPLVHQAIARLELIADTYLSVATPVQLALPRLLAAAPAIQAQISARTRHNLATLRAACRDTALTVLDLDAGWTALLRLPAVHDLDDDAWALQLLARARILTQPGNLYDLHDPPHLAVSLLTPESTLAAACDRLRAVVAEVLASGPCCP